VTALDNVSLSIPEGSIVGLIGKNGSGKTTLMRHIIGLYLPTSGECHTLGCPSGKLGSAELSRIGIVHQENLFLDWMTVEQHLRYVASFYRTWDRDRETRLLRELELEPKARVGTLSPGNAQKLGILLAVCHRPSLLLLDEPVSALDPIAREAFLRFLFELLQEDDSTVVISSHILRDVEKVVDHVICLDRGRVRADAPLDALQVRYSEWRVTAPAGRLPVHFEEPFILSQQVDGRQAHVLVRDATDRIEAFRQRYGADVVSAPLNLERMFPLLLREEA
jgi:ABC-2 type transport system ATP-binding protein